MTGIHAKRNARIVSVGGGIVQDITGFTANILYRGISWTFIPTTLLAASDSCIGGKTSLNYRKFKNLLGTFYPPDEIFICPSFFKTLTQRDFESGLGEVVKFNIMAGTEGLQNIEASLDALLSRDGEILNKCVENSLRFKKEFIEEDEFDRGERIKLNFAHTFGHGIETITGYEIPHGTAVAIGMIMANRISVKRNLLTEETAARSEKVLLDIIHISYDFRQLNMDDFINAIRKDKKQINDSLTAVLMTDRARDLRIVHDIDIEEIKDCVGHFVDLYYD
jgi:3-dehydroquinate synthase